MATNNDNIQINSFIKGMNSDVDYTMLLDGLYVMAENIRVSTTENDKFGKVRTIEGFNFIQAFQDVNVEKILATASIRNYGIVIYLDSECWKVAVIKEDEFNEHQDLDDYTVFKSGVSTERDRFSVVTKYETEDAVKVYIADGEHPIILLNIADSNLSRLIDLSLDDVFIYSKVNFTLPVVEISTGGNLKGSLVQYSYRLYSKYLQTTAISPLSKLLPLYRNNNGLRGVLQSETSDCKAEVKIEIKQEDQVNDYILVFRVTYFQNGQLPTIELIYDNKYQLNNNVFTLIDSGRPSLLEFTLEEYNAGSGIHIIPEILESKDDILFASKIKDTSYSQLINDEDVDNCDVNITTIDLPGIALDDNLNSEVVYILNQNDPVVSFRRNEYYNFGIIFYDKYGNRSKVKTIPELPSSNSEAFTYNDGVIYANKTGFLIIIEDWPENAVSYEIVRSVRTIDVSNNITQGVVSIPVHIRENPDTSTGEFTNEYAPSGFLTTNRMMIGNQFVDLSDDDDSTGILLFVSPEVLYLPNNLIDIINKRSYNLIFKKRLHQMLIPTYNQGDIWSAKIPNSTLTFGCSHSENYFFDIDTNKGDFYDFELPDIYHYININNKSIVSVNDLYTANKNSIVYLKPYESGLHEGSFDLKIINIKYSSEYKWNEAVTKNPNSSSDLANFKDKAVGISLYTFHNIINSEKDFNSIPDEDNFTGLGGRCFVLKCENNNIPRPNLNFNVKNEFVVDVYNIVNKNRVSYDEYSAYYSFGDFYTIDNTLPRLILNVFSGDTFLNLIEYVSCHKYYGVVDPMHGMQTEIIYALPLESNVNTIFSSGDLFSKLAPLSDNLLTNLQIEPADVNGIYNQERPLYQYNTVYSTYPNAKVFYKDVQEHDESLDNIDVRTYYSNKKLSGETIDGWSIFQPANYLDVDSRYGALTNLRMFYDKLFFWQEHAVGVFSVNERTLISDDNNLPLILGTGGVLDRYDYLDLTSGMKPQQFCDTISPSTLYWFDEENNEIKAYRNGSGIIPLTKQLGVQNIMNEYKKNYPQSNVLFYDAANNEVVAKVLSLNRSMVYNEQLNAFTSIYDLDYDEILKYPKNIYGISYGRNFILSKYNEVYHTQDGDVYSKATFRGQFNNSISYVVNKYPLYTKVFDNLEIVTKDLLKDYYDDDYHNYSWNTELGTSTENPTMTDRYGNYRYAVPRMDTNQEYGERLRGKYMKCTILNVSPNKNASISYIITKFRISWS